MTVITATQRSTASAKNKIELGLLTTVKLPTTFKLPTQLARFNGSRRKLVVIDRNQPVHANVRAYLRNHETHGDLFTHKLTAAKRAENRANA